MAYSAIEDITDKLGLAVFNNLTQKTDENDPEPEKKVEQAIQDADAIINSYIRERVSQIPIDPVPDLIKQYSRDLAICHLYKNQPQFIPEHWKGEKENIIRSLRDISNGAANLDTGPPEDKTIVKISYGSGENKIRRDRPL